MDSLIPWKLLLFLCATSFGELAKVAPVENPRTLGHLGPAPWAQGLGCTEAKLSRAALSPREASLCPPGQSSAGRQRPGLCAPRGRPSPAPRGAVLVQREKDLAAYNWNSFGLRYGKRLATPGSDGPGRRRGRP